jgi:beta-lactamase class A
MARGADARVMTRGEMSMRELTQRLNELCDPAPFQTSWYLKDLTTDQQADRLGAVPVPSASTRKISIMMAALQAVHAGKLALDQSVTIEARYQDNDSGTFQHLTPGFAITLRDALVMMIIVSDNTCTGMVADLVGLDNIQRFCESVGMTGTIHRFGIPPRLGRDHTLAQVTTTTPNDQGLLLELILRGTADVGAAARLGGTPALCRLALNILSWQKLKARLPSLLPLGTRVAHKTGTGARGYMDAGIVYKGERPLFILTAYTEHVPDALADGTPGFAAANQLIGRMARLCYDTLESKA